jgi:hypothetical protein
MKTVSLGLDAADEKQGNLIVKRPRLFNPSPTIDQPKHNEGVIPCFQPIKELTC